MAEYIEKQAVINEVDEWYGIYLDSDTAREALSLLKKWVKKISPADVRPVTHGKWIEVYDDLIAGTCSACGWNSYMYEDDVIGMNYCPNCGAYMKGERVSEDD
jgi:hypothetical protein